MNFANHTKLMYRTTIIITIFKEKLPNLQIYLLFLLYLNQFVFYRSPYCSIVYLFRQEVLLFTLFIVSFNIRRIL